MFFLLKTFASYRPCIFTFNILHNSQSLKKHFRLPDFTKKFNQNQNSTDIRLKLVGLYASALIIKFTNIFR